MGALLTPVHLIVLFTIAFVLFFVPLSSKRRR